MGSRKCSDCGNVGHNSRTCPNHNSNNNNNNNGEGRLMKLFGVQLFHLSSSIKKSFSVDCLSSSSHHHHNIIGDEISDINYKFSTKFSDGGYLSDGFIATTSSSHRKKGMFMYIYQFFGSLFHL